MQALQAFTDEGEQPTLRDLAFRSLVGLRDANTTMSNLVRAGHAEINGTRRVHYRNRPVALYGMPIQDESLDAVTTLAEALSSWSTQQP